MRNKARTNWKRETHNNTSLFEIQSVKTIHYTSDHILWQKSIYLWIMQWVKQETNSKRSNLGYFSYLRDYIIRSNMIFIHQEYQNWLLHHYLKIYWIFKTRYHWLIRSSKLLKQLCKHRSKLMIDLWCHGQQIFWMILSSVNKSHPPPSKAPWEAAPFLTPAETKILVLLSSSVERFGVSRMQDFFLSTIFAFSLN